MFRSVTPELSHRRHSPDWHNPDDRRRGPCVMAPSRLRSGGIAFGPVLARVHPELERLLARPCEVPSGHELTAARVRADELAVLDLQGPPIPMHAIEDVSIACAGGLDARVYRPKPGPLPTMIYFHGGGFVIGSEGYERPLRELARATGCLVIAPHVRRAPEHRFPAAV